MSAGVDALPCGCGAARPCPRGARLFATGHSYPLRCHLEIEFTRALGGAVLDHLDPALRQRLARIADEYGVTAEEVISREQTQEVAGARHAWWSWLRDRGMSYPQIGCLTGHDHSTVHDGIRKHRRAGAAA